MRKEVVCKNCKHILLVNSWASDRIELAREKGEVFKIRCKNCKEICEYNVNDVSAKPNSVLNTILLISVFILMALIGCYLYNVYWGKSFYMIFALPIAVAIPGMIYFTYIKTQNNNIRIFNRFRK